MSTKLNRGAVLAAPRSKHLARQSCDSRTFLVLASQWS
jgi:hypothetical protein